MKSRIMLTVASAAAFLPAAALAQATSSGQIDQRVGKLEKEMKAVQRTVFPDGAPIQPEIAASTGPVGAPGTPAATPIADLTARVDALERTLASLTGQIEQAGFQNRQQDEAIKRLEARVSGPAEGAAPATSPPEVPLPSVGDGGRGPLPVTSRSDAVSAIKPLVVATRNDPARKAAVAAVDMPATGDAAEDAYTYGFRLYSAKLYPEAQASLKGFVAKYPAHRRASYAQNLLGRAYLDEGKPALASVALYDNYQKMPKGDRAPESLYWLGQALTKLKKLPDACKVYDELQDVYAAKLTPDLKAKAIRGRADAKCTA